jgi:hypothetical protein
VNLSELEKLAKAATPGPWSNREAEGLDECIWSDKGQAWIMYNDEFQSMPQNDSDFIAAANPETILAMIELLRDMAEELESCLVAFSEDEDIEAVLAKYKEMTK